MTMASSSQHICGVISIEAIKLRIAVLASESRTPAVLSWEGLIPSVLIPGSFASHQVLRRLAG